MKMLWGEIIEEYILQDHPRQCAVADCDTELVFWTDIPCLFLWSEPGLIKLVLRFRWPQPKDEMQPNSQRRPLECVQQSKDLIATEVLCNITFNIF